MTTLLTSYCSISILKESKHKSDIYYGECRFKLFLTLDRTRGGSDFFHQTRPGGAGPELLAPKYSFAVSTAIENTILQVLPGQKTYSFRILLGEGDEQIS